MVSDDRDNQSMGTLHRRQSGEIGRRSREVERWAYRLAKLSGGEITATASELEELADEDGWNGPTIGSIFGKASDYFELVEVEKVRRTASVPTKWKIELVEDLREDDEPTVFEVGGRWHISTEQGMLVVSDDVMREIETEVSRIRDLKY